MTFIAKLVATLNGDSKKQTRKGKSSFHRQQMITMKRFSQPLVSGWK